VSRAPENLPAIATAAAAATATAGARPRLDALVAALARLVVRIFFRELEVVGAARLPASGPLVVVANHQNGMIDPLLIVAALTAPGTAAGAGAGRMPRFLATHMLWRNPALRPWLELGGVIPIYRPKDVGPAADPAQNAAAFARCHEQLAAGGAVALFPEGTSHSEPGLAPLKTGAARIVLEAARRFPGLAPLVVPIGLTFEAKGTFRSRALVEIGEPIDPAPEIALDGQMAAAEGDHRAAAGLGGKGAPAAAGDPGAAGSPNPAGGSAGGAPAAAAASAPAVRALTARIDTGLKAVTLNYGSWEEARRIGRAAELFSRRPGGSGDSAAAPAGGAGLPGEAPLAERFSLRRAFIEGYAELCRRYPEATAAAAAAVDRYDRMLAALGLRDDQVTATYPAAAVARWLGLTVLRLVVYLPLAAVGIVLNWLPYRLVGEIAARATRESDMPASFKVFGGIVLFPVTWLLDAVLAARLAGPRPVAQAAAALLTLVAAPLSGWVALHFDDRRGQLWREARAYLLLRSRRAIAGELLARREAAAREVAALADLYRSLAG
jgi:glycerol-3-phosphate O-acyltransferase/dihydroxyacetone phosphate acyltransferase